MDLKAISTRLGVSARTVSNWRDEGAPLSDMDALVVWLRERRHTSRATKQILDRRTNIEAKAKSFLRAYVALAQELSAPLASDWEAFLSASLHQGATTFENVAMLLNPEVAVDLKDRTFAEKLRAETWPVSGGPSELDETPSAKHDAD